MTIFRTWKDYQLSKTDENKTKDRWRMSFLVGYVLKDSFMNVGKEIKRERIDIE